MISLRTLAVVVLLGWLGGSGSLRAATKMEWPLGKRVTVEITEFGGIARITDSGKLVTGNAQLFLHKSGKEGVIYQGSGFVAGNEAQLKRSDSDVVATGSLQNDKTPDSTKVLDFTVTYKKTSDDELKIRIDVTYLTDGTWSIPAQFSFSFPFAEYTGAQFVTVDHEGTERTYEFGAEALKFAGYGFKSAQLIKGKQSVTFEPVDGTSINFQDSRSWGGDYLRIDLMAKQEWKTPFAFKAGAKQSFETKITFKNAN